MPCLNISANLSLDGVDTSSILADATSSVAKIIRKPEGYVMIVLKGSVPISFGGTEQPAAYGELVSIGGLSPDVNKKLSVAISSILEDKLDINQSELRILDLSDNQIQGDIPNWIWRFKSLRVLNLSCNFLETLGGNPINLTSMLILDLHSNRLHGKIPIPSTPQLLNLDYSSNNFNSTIPATVGDMLPNLKYLFVTSNNLQGAIPSSICNFLQLRFLDMSNNSLNGTIPHCLTSLNTLSTLHLGRNHFTSVDNLSSNCNLENLDIGNNQIQGEFPKSLVKCLKLKVLNVGRNQITGIFPCFLKTITTLRVVVLRSNKFYGGIGCYNTNKQRWPELQVIDIAHNEFSGIVPRADLATWHTMISGKFEDPRKLIHGFRYYLDTIQVIIKGNELELENIYTIFTVIDFSCNKFIGKIPDEIGGLKSLQYLNLSHNDFTGAIPISLSSLSQLEALDLSQNTLSGQIPVELEKLTFLSLLNLSHNQLEGRIPSTQFLTFPKSSFEGNKGLFWLPLNNENITRLSPQTTTDNRFPDSEDEIEIEIEIEDEIENFWNLTTVEVGLACWMGVAIGSLWFCKRWRFWYYTTMYGILLRLFPQLDHWFGRHKRHVYLGARYPRRLR